MHLTVFCGSRIHATEPTLPTGECMSIVRKGFLSLAALAAILSGVPREAHAQGGRIRGVVRDAQGTALSGAVVRARSEEHTSELQSRPHLVCRLLLEKKKQIHTQRACVRYDPDVYQTI